MNDDEDRDTVGDRVVEAPEEAVMLPVGDLDIELRVDADGLTDSEAPVV